MATKNFMSNILDELMGRNRDALPTDIPKEIQWDDPEICPYYLVCFCPHELFVNTKADLGSCSKFHDDQLRKKYMEEAPAYKRSQFEKEFLRFAEKMISDIEGKIKRGKHRIAAANGADGGIYAGPGSRNAEEIVLLTDRINALLEEAETAGCEGDVEKAQGIMKLCDQIKEEREKLKSNEIAHPWNPDKAMQVCEVCGSYLIIGEAQHRLDDHIMGKQHVGFAMLRKNMDDVRQSLQKRDAEEREQMELERERRLSNRRSSPIGDKRRDGSSRRGGVVGDRGRDYRDRDRDRDRNRKRSRSKDNDKKDKDKGKDRSRSRSKDKDKKDKDSTSRDKDKERSRSEKDKDRNRGGDKDKEKDRDRNRKRDSSRDRKRHSETKKDRRSKRSRSRSGSKTKGRKRSRSRSKSRDRRDRGHDRHSHRRNRSRSRDKDKKRSKDEVSPKKVKETVDNPRSPGQVDKPKGHVDGDDVDVGPAGSPPPSFPDSSNPDKKELFTEEVEEDEEKKSRASSDTSN